MRVLCLLALVACVAARAAPAVEYLYLSSFLPIDMDAPFACPPATLSADTVSSFEVRRVTADGEWHRQAPVGTQWFVGCVCVHVFVCAQHNM